MQVEPGVPPSAPHRPGSGVQTAVRRDVRQRVAAERSLMAEWARSERQVLVSRNSQSRSKVSRHEQGRLPDGADVAAADRDHLFDRSREVVAGYRCDGQIGGPAGAPDHSTPAAEPLAAPSPPRGI